MSSKEMLEAAGRALTLPPRTVLAGDARVLLLVLPPLLPPPLVPVCLVLALRPPGPRLLWPRDVEFGLEMVLSSCSMEHKSAMRASKSTVSPWFNASLMLYIEKR